MNRGRMNIVVFVALISTLSLAVSACGRKGPLEDPPGASAPVTDQQQSDTETKPAKPDRRFILDGLI